MRGAVTTTKPIGELRGNEFVLVDHLWPIPGADLTKHAPEARAALENPLWSDKVAGPDLMRRWLGSLALLVAGRMSSDEAKSRVAIYAEMLGVRGIPAAVLTKEGLERAASKFTWFPSYAEVSSFIGEDVEIFTELRRRLVLIAALDDKGPDGA